MNKLFLSIVLVLIFSVSRAQVFTLPYFDDFESGAPGWNSFSSNSQWQLGLPTMAPTNSVYSGSSCWDVDLNSSYSNSALTTLVSPKIDVTGYNNLKISFWQNYSCENMWDGVVLQYATDTIGQWQIVGSVNALLSYNWYNESNLNSSGLPAWTGNTGGWINSYITIANPSATGNIWFKFVFTSDGSVIAGSGFSIDDFLIEDSEYNVAYGSVYLDVNSNYLTDAGDVPLPNVSLQLNSASGNYTFLTDNSGVYTAFLESGVPTTITANTPLYSTVLPANYTMTITGTNQVSNGNDFLITFTPGITDVSVNLNGTNIRPGFNHTKFLDFTNLGTEPSSGTIELTVDPILTVINTSEPYTVTSPNTIQFSYANLLPLQTHYITIQYLVDSAAVVGSTTLASVVITPALSDTNLVNNTDNTSQLVVNSFDPNNKLVDPEGDISVQQVTAGMDLNYTINFQNTGSATAIDVNVFDILDANLDISTFEFTHSSHPVATWSINSNRQLQFVFDDINLADSSTNESASHGYVSYKIRPLTSLIQGSQINNTAAIFFDNNAPVLTNTVTTNILIPTGINSPAAADQIALFPNPSKGDFYIQADKEFTTYQIFNSIGQQVMNGSITNPGQSQRIDADQLSTGMYMVIVNGINKTSKTKLILE